MHSPKPAKTLHGLCCMYTLRHPTTILQPGSPAEAQGLEAIHGLSTIKEAVRGVSHPMVQLFYHLGDWPKGRVINAEVKA